jgi:hypothetical protein
MAPRKAEAAPVTPRSFYDGLTSPDPALRLAALQGLTAASTLPLDALAQAGIPLQLAALTANGSSKEVQALAARTLASYATAAPAPAPAAAASISSSGRSCQTQPAALVMLEALHLSPVVEGLWGVLTEYAKHAAGGDAANAGEAAATPRKVSSAAAATAPAAPASITAAAGPRTPAGAAAASPAAGAALPPDHAFMVGGV